MSPFTTQKNGCRCKHHPAFLSLLAGVKVSLMKTYPFFFKILPKFRPFARSQNARWFDQSCKPNFFYLCRVVHIHEHGVFTKTLQQNCKRHRKSLFSSEQRPQVFTKTSQINWDIERTSDCGYLEIFDATLKDEVVYQHIKFIFPLIISSSL